MLDLSRILQIFIVQPIIAFIFIFIFLRIILNDRKRLNYSFSGFYICIIIAAILNIIYSLVRIEIIIISLNFITNFFVSFAPIFLYFFNQIILKSPHIYKLKDQLRIGIIYASFLILSVIFYVFGCGVTINESTNWTPKWYLPYYLYMNIVTTIFTIIPLFFTSFKIYKKFNDKKLKKRWKYYLIGLVGLFFYMYGAYFNNLIDNSSFRLIFSLFGLSVILWLFLLYYGVGRHLI